jgi:DNA-binding CsgD family transcriptional regulator
MMEGPAGCRVQVIGGNRLAGKQLCEILHEEPGFHAEWAAELPAEFREVPDVFLIDFTDLTKRPEATLRIASTRYPAAKFVLLVPGSRDSLNASSPDDPLIDLLLLLVRSTHGVVAIEEVESFLRTAIYVVRHGSLCLPVKFFEAHVRMNLTMAAKDEPSIYWTPRERTLLELLARRLSNREIAEILGLTVGTIKFYVSNMLSKAGVSSRRELASLAFVENTKNLSDPPPRKSLRHKA